jgi:hypothetical protein
LPLAQTDTPTGVAAAQFVHATKHALNAFRFPEDAFVGQHMMQVPLGDKHPFAVRHGDTLLQCCSPDVFGALDEVRVHVATGDSRLNDGNWVIWVLLFSHALSPLLE